METLPNDIIRQILFYLDNKDNLDKLFLLVNSEKQNIIRAWEKNNKLQLKWKLYHSFKSKPHKELKDRFKEESLHLWDNIIHVVKEVDRDNNTSLAFLNIGKMVMQYCKASKLIDKFIKTTSSYWIEILNRDEEFMLSKIDVISKSLPIQGIKDIAALHSVVSKEDKEIVWEYLEILIIISIRYIEKKPLNISLDNIYLSI